MSEQEKPFKVQTTAGVKAGECDTLEAAESSAAERNARAAGMGISARYESAPND